MCGMSKHCWCRSERERNWCERVTKGAGVCVRARYSIYACMGMCGCACVCVWVYVVDMCVRERKSWAKYYLRHDCERRPQRREWKRAKLKRRLLLFTLGCARVGVCVCARVRVCVCACVRVCVRACARKFSSECAFAWCRVRVLCVCVSERKRGREKERIT